MGILSGLHGSNREYHMGNSKTNNNLTIWEEIDKSLCEFQGPYQCPNCHGHLMLDGTYLDQVTEYIKCPYCLTISKVDE